MRYLWLIIGFTSLGFAIVGAILPMLPTTPFVLLSVGCFSRSSPRFHSWLLNHRLTGPMIRNWEARGAISLRAKIAASVMIAISLGASMGVQLAGWIVVVQVIVLSGVLAFIWTRPSA